MAQTKRVPVNFRFDALNWDFIKMMAQIAHYADAKYGSAEQYADSRLDGEKSPANHIVEHLRLYLTGKPHDHFGDRIFHLVAIAYNAMMEALYLRRFGRPEVVLNLDPEPLKVGQEVEDRVSHAIYSLQREHTRQIKNWRRDAQLGHPVPVWGSLIRRQADEIYEVIKNENFGEAYGLDIKTLPSKATEGEGQRPDQSARELAGEAGRPSPGVVRGLDGETDARRKDYAPYRVQQDALPKRASEG